MLKRAILTTQLGLWGSVLIISGYLFLGSRSLSLVLKGSQVSRCTVDSNWNWNIFQLSSVSSLQDWILFSV